MMARKAAQGGSRRAAKGATRKGAPAAPARKGRKQAASASAPRSATHHASASENRTRGHPASRRPRNVQQWRVGVADTTFSRVDMGAIAMDELARLFGDRAQLLRVVVPGVKDLPVAAKRLIELEGCHMVVACGMPGPEEIDQQCAHEASQGMQQAMLATNTHILEVFVHMNEVARGDDEALATLAANRVKGHALNCYLMLAEPQRMVERAGQGIRQGFGDEGPAVASPSRNETPPFARRRREAAGGPRRR